MSNLIVVLMGGLSGERKISFLTGKACSNALKKKGYKVINLDAKGYFVEKLIYQVHDKVFHKTGINLELELQIIGEKL